MRGIGVTPAEDNRPGAAIAAGRARVRPGHKN